jgi:hypothetical protein
VTVRHAILSVAAMLALGVGVYLLVEVRTRTPSQMEPSGRTSLPRPPAGPAARSERAALVPSWPGPPARGPSDAAGPPDAASSDLKLDAEISEATKAFDRGDFAYAKRLATRLLTGSPTNVSMLRIMVSASCIEGDGAVAQANYAMLPPVEQEQMKSRCARYGVTFSDLP